MKSSKVEFQWGIVTQSPGFDNPFRKSSRVLIMITPTMDVVIQPVKKGRIIKSHENELDLLEYIKPLEPISYREIPPGFRLIALEELCKVHERFATDVFNHEY